MDTLRLLEAYRDDLENLYDDLDSLNRLTSGTPYFENSDKADEYLEHLGKTIEDLKMNKNKTGRDRICMTKENVANCSATSARNILNDEEQYCFESYATMAFCASIAGVDLQTFEEAIGRPAHHGYEVEQFFQDQVDGITSRFYNAPEDESLYREMRTQEVEGKEEDSISQAVSGQHYNDVVPGFQYMEMMQHMLEGKDGVEAHLLGQVYKYLMRTGKKDEVEQEYRKARWYLNCLVKYKQTGQVDCEGND